MYAIRSYYAVGAVDQDGVGARNVDAVFDDGGADQQVALTFDEVEHHLLQRVFLV